MLSISADLLRVDPLTGCRNFLGFLEDGLDCCLGKSLRETISMGCENTPEELEGQPNAILFVEMKGVKFLNDTKGHAHGDSAIHWMGILLQEESSSPVFRLGGVEFAVILNLNTETEYIHFLDRLVARMNRESEQLEFPNSPADIALILYDQTPTSPDSVLLQLSEAMLRVKNSGQSQPILFHSRDFNIFPKNPNTWYPDNDGDISFAVRWMARKNIFQVLEMGNKMDSIQQEAFTDAISNLPNMKAALLHMEQILEDAVKKQTCFSILMIDGDNIRRYNTINYAAGDEMIREMSAVLKENLRPNDFVARWRSGDEFIVILPETNSERANVVGERFRLAVKEASLSWKFPTTISIGIASFPKSGNNLNFLIDTVEAANKEAKRQGKDRVVYL